MGLIAVSVFVENVGGGAGYICSLLPTWIVSVAGAPAARRVDLVNRATGRMVASTWSASDGTYRFDGIDPREEFDVLGRDWSGTYNDVIWSRVRPVPYDVQSLSGAFAPNNGARVLEGAIAVVGGEAHAVSVSSGSAPPGITFAVETGSPPLFPAAGFWLTASGSADPGAYTWDLRVTAANGTRRTISCLATFT